MADPFWVESAGARPRSIIEIWGERITRALVMRMLCGAWLVPAASLIWIGLATTGIRRTSDASQALALGRTQATAIVLAVFTVLIGASVFVRQSAAMVDVGVPRPKGIRSLWLWSHLIALGVAVPTVLVGAAVETTATTLLPVAALTGFWAGLAIPRALVRHPGAWSGPLAALAVGISFQLTLGWLHVVHPSASPSPVLLIEGLILAWAAASAARVDPFAPPAMPVIETGPAELVGSTAGFSRASAQRSIPEAAVGR